MVRVDENATGGKQKGLGNKPSPNYYQTSGAGSNPVVSTTVLTVSARPIGNGQKIWISFAWEGLERSRPFLILIV